MCGIFVSAAFSNQDSDDVEGSQKQFDHICSQLQMANALRGNPIFSVLQGFPSENFQVLMPRVLV